MAAGGAPGGNLAALFEQMTRQVRAFTSTAKTDAAAHDNLARLRLEVAHLRERHGIVKRQLQMARQRTVAEVVEHRTSDERQLLVPADRLKRNQKEVAHEIIASTSLHMETELHLCYRILGRSVTELTEPDNRVCIRLETFHDGCFYESYFLVLGIEPGPETQNLVRVYKHTLPHFIPLSQIEERFLNQDVKGFCDSLSDYLNAFVARRVQIQRLQRGLAELALDSMPVAPSTAFITSGDQSINTGIPTFIANDSFEFVEISQNHLRQMHFPLLRTSPSEVECSRVAKEGSSKRLGKLEAAILSASDFVSAILNEARSHE